MSDLASQSSVAALRVLLVEDDGAYARLVRELLVDAMGPRLVVHHAETLTEALTRLESTRELDVVLLDLGLPDSEGLESVTAVREKSPGLPIVILSGLEDVETALAAMRLGAQEYLVKGQFEDALLSRALRYAIERKAREDFEQLLIGIVSHDLKSPLQTLTFSCELLQRSGLDVSQTQVVSRMRSSIGRASRLVRDLLDLTRARLRAGGLPIDPVVCDAHEVVESTISEHRVTSRDRTIDLATRGDGRGPFDGGRLAQIVTNLVTNAIEHSPANSVIEVVSEGTDRELCLRVRNQGTPIPPALMRSIFDPLQRGAPRDVEEPSPCAPNVGLGLFIVREVARAHGGRVDVESNAAQGTTFTVCLPKQSIVEPAGTTDD